MAGRTAQKSQATRQSWKSRCRMSKRKKRRRIIASYAPELGPEVPAGPQLTDEDLAARFRDAAQTGLGWETDGAPLTPVGSNEDDRAVANHPNGEEARDEKG